MKSKLFRERGVGGRRGTERVASKVAFNAIITSSWASNYTENYEVANYLNAIRNRSRSCKTARRNIDSRRKEKKNETTKKWEDTSREFRIVFRSQDTHRT